MSNATALVTGGNGFLAFRLVNDLLEKGYNVITSIRSTDPKKVQKLFNLQAKHHGKLEIAQADLLDAGALDESIQNVDVVFHTATPVIVGPNPDFQNNMLKPAVEGLRNVLDSCLKSTRVKTIVMTSTLMTVFSMPPQRHSVTEDDWNSIERLEQFPYAYSKVQAEKLFWEFDKKHGDRLRCVSINPSLILGPYLNFEEEDVSPYQYLYMFIDPYVNGKASSYPGGDITCVDVRDTVKAHIAALENPSAKGRYLLTCTTLAWSHFINILKKNFPHDNYPVQNGKDSEYIKSVNCSKAIRELGIEFTPYEKTIVDMAKQIAKKN